MRSELLEPGALRGARPVLRGGGGSDAASLPDRSLAIWEVDTWGRLDEFGQATLWQGFERWLSSRFPAATRIFTDDAEPGEDTTRNRDFLRGLGYAHVTGTHRIFAKGV